MNRALRVVLLGTLRPATAFWRLRGCSDLLRLIWEAVAELSRRSLVTDSVPCILMHDKSSVQFPPATNININMMPFVLGDNRTLPDAYAGYLPLIELCATASPQCVGKIVYLTIQESSVAAGTTQRRAGLHTETPGTLARAPYSVPVELVWGRGHTTNRHVVGGIFLASTVADSCQIWPCEIARGSGLIGPLGDIEHLRTFLPTTGKLHRWSHYRFLQSYLDSNPEMQRIQNHFNRIGEVSDRSWPIKMDANELWWLTDTTPHEALPVPRDDYRQFFRLVVGDVSVWYRRHSTANPLGVCPDAHILDDDKFASSVQEATEVKDKRVECSLS
eukprot:gnl/Spiro4/17850_TR9500_c0_g1_i1.p1 gnl/Spiro4/17850_TR9500_c0_g1~~gnl/Spiro4/17850_TR9500_c0_g1_i1.p1  ORF type:complete len:338 (+),score=116.57 gnl/Spiro4/17850_TR9500_c0_g1_i1:23-1015(+)